MAAVVTMTTSPKVTVLIPLYNAERYLAEALASILEQTFTDFELLVIDDGSTDTSVAIVRSFGDPRIRLVSNAANLGVTITLNRGIDLARGEYIARMDSDDICLPNRLAEQVAFLDAHPECAMVAVPVQMIAADGRDCGDWSDDRRTTSPETIRRFLPRANCIAHPGVMIRTALLAVYRYDGQQRVAQDYDLWLRLCADGHVIAKLAEPLLRYRLNPASVTAVTRGLLPDLKNVRTKARFLRRRLVEGTLNRFCLRVAVAMVQDLCYTLGKGVLGVVRPLVPATGAPDAEQGAVLARDLRIMALNRWLPVRLLVGIGMFLGRFLPVSNRSALFLFFPFFHVGGAEKVHAQVVDSCAAHRPWVFFTKKSANSTFRPLFPAQARLFNLWPLLKYGYPLSVGIMAGLINRHRSPVVFGSNSLFFYLLVPYLHARVRRGDLLHATGGGAEQFSLAVADHLDFRVVANETTLAELRDLYRQRGMDSLLAGRLLLIENMVPVPDQCPDKDRGGLLQVLYVGRGGSEKRLHLLVRAAQRCRQAGIPVLCTLVGDLAAAVAPLGDTNCRLLGEIADAQALAEIYAGAHVLVLTSSREGFPLVIMEAMAHGVVPVSTRVGGIDRHVRHGENGMLLDNGPEEVIVEELVATLCVLARDRDLLATLGQHAHATALASFGPDRFRAAYQKLLGVPCHG
jgi:L-malate glycosyltransferase